MLPVYTHLPQSLADNLRRGNDPNGLRRSVVDFTHAGLSSIPVIPDAGSSFTCVAGTPQWKAGGLYLDGATAWQGPQLMPDDYDWIALWLNISIVSSTPSGTFFSRGMDGSGSGWSLSLAINTSGYFYAACVSSDTGFTTPITTKIKARPGHRYSVGLTRGYGSSLTLFVSDDVGNYETTSIATVANGLRNSTVGYVIGRINISDYANGIVVHSLYNSWDNANSYMETFFWQQPEFRNSPQFYEQEVIGWLPLRSVTGSHSVTFDPLSFANTGTLAIAGAHSQALADFTKSQAGALTITGSHAQTISALVQAQTGTLSIIGQHAHVLDVITQLATGVVGGLPPIVGGSSVTFGDFTATATGAVAVSGSGAVTLEQFAAIQAGAILTTGQAAQVISAITDSKTGAVAIAGSHDAVMAAITQLATGRVYDASAVIQTTDKGLVAIVERRGVLALPAEDRGIKWTH